MYISWVEIKRFFKDYYKMLLIATLVFSLLFSAGLTFLNTNSAQTSDDNSIEEIETGVELDSSPAYFQFYTEYEEMGQFTNDTLFRQYLNLSSVKEDVLNATGVDIIAIEEEYQELYQDEEFSVLNILRDSNSNLYTLVINAGNDADNLLISEYYYGLIIERDIPFLQDKYIYPFVEPRLIADTDGEDETQQLTEELRESTPSSQTILIPLIRNIIIGLILGFVLLIGLSLVKALYSKHINYSFAYEIGENDAFMLYDSSLNNMKNVGQFIGLPFGKQKLVLSEHNLNPNQKELLSKNKDISFNEVEEDQTQLIEKSSLVDIEINNNFAEIIIVVLPYKTSRKWYKTQRELIKLSKTPIKVIQVNG